MELVLLLLNTTLLTNVTLTLPNPCYYAKPMLNTTANGFIFLVFEEGLKNRFMKTCIQVLQKENFSFRFNGVKPGKYKIVVLIYSKNFPPKAYLSEVNLVEGKKVVIKIVGT